MKARIVDHYITPTKKGVQVNIVMQAAMALHTINSSINKGVPFVKDEFLWKLIQICGFHKSSPTKMDLADLAQSVDQKILDTESEYSIKFDKEGKPVWLEKCCTEESLLDQLS
jgi:hypothetical protein